MKGLSVKVIIYQYAVPKTHSLTNFDQANPKSSRIRIGCDSVQLIKIGFLGVSFIGKYLGIEISMGFQLCQPRGFDLIPSPPLLHCSSRGEERTGNPQLAQMLGLKTSCYAHVLMHYSNSWSSVKVSNTKLQVDQEFTLKWDTVKQT